MDHLKGKERKGKKREREKGKEKGKGKGREKRKGKEGKGKGKKKEKEKVKERSNEHLNFLAVLGTFLICKNFDILLKENRNYISESLFKKWFNNFKMLGEDIRLANWRM